ncbi:hypothetical protein B296_00001000 [Ensete ventricosum]|uniref:Cyclic nucleotide-binding domain-containing protein n=1 Tax=Ensete ventricosum TaxID=4639 RepID=A0A427B9Q3_ENSVE|nr:hypothetical protein B296_00001000 [Ensete ventricosum]
MLAVLAMRRVFVGGGCRPYLCQVGCTSTGRPPYIRSVTCVGSVTSVGQLSEGVMTWRSCQHLSYQLQVPMFEKMDDQLMDAMSDLLKPVLYTECSCIVRDGDPVNEMLFIMRGKLENMATNGGRTGFFNSDILQGWRFLWGRASDLGSSSSLPISTRTVKTLSEIEAFALKFGATQFRRLHSKQLQHTFRYHSQQWRT